MIRGGWLVWILASGCASPKEPQGGESSEETGVASPDSASGETAEPGDSGAECAAPPWQTAEAQEPVSMGDGEGVSADELADAQAIADAVLEDSSTAAVFWRESGSERYVVHTTGGTFGFTQARNDEGDLVLAWEGAEPLLLQAYQDVSLEEELAYGNPEETSFADQGYASDDPRLAYPDIAQTSYPRLMRRIAQIFAGSNGPDLGIALGSWANGGVGSHGGMDLYQSRAPLVFRGPGIVPGTYAMTADHVDIAPTVAGLLGVAPVRGVDGRRGRWVDGQLLKWQDGRVLDEILLPECAYGAAQRAVVIILDGLSHTELFDGVTAGRTPNLARLVDASAAVVGGGAIVGWPSFSLPGHTSVHTGVYQGHHGLLSSSFLDRSTGQTVPGVSLDEALLDPASGAEAISAAKPTATDSRD